MASTAPEHELTLFPDGATAPAPLTEHALCHGDGPLNDPGDQDDPGDYDLGGYDDPGALDPVPDWAGPAWSQDDSWRNEPHDNDPNGPDEPWGRPTASVDDLVAHLNDRQAEAVRTLTGPLLIVAGPGSGKTRVLTHRIAALLATGAAPRSILAVTFTNKAAAEMRDRVGDLVGHDLAKRMWICTFHAACVKILRQDGPAVGLPARFSIADTDDAKKILTRLIKGDLDAAQRATLDTTPHPSGPGTPGDAPTSTGDPALDNALRTLTATLTPGSGGGKDKDLSKTVRETQSAISWAKNHLLSADDMAASTRADLRAAASWRHRYDAELARQGLVDFDDLLTRTLTLLDKHPDIRARWQNRFHHLLIDEYQDTNPVQYRIIGNLVSQDRNICVVGDRQQAIYGFRAATPEAFDTFTNDWPGTKVVALDQNYRSTQRIVKTSAALIEPLQANSKTRTDLWTANDAGPIVKLRRYTDGDTEARRIAEEIADNHLSGRRRPDQHAILYRTNAQSRVFETELNRAGVPYRVVGGQRYWDRAEVRDAMAWLKLLINPNDLPALERATTVPRRRLGDGGLLAWYTHARTAGQDPISYGRTALRDDTQVPDELRRSIKPIRSFLDELDQLEAAARTGGPEAAAKGVLAIGGFVAAATESGSRGALAQERRENLEELPTAAASFVNGGPAPTTGIDPATLSPWDQLGAFLESAALMSGGDEDDQVDAAQLMTAHAAKGKEFPVTYVVGVEDGFFPHATTRSDDELDEERRLLFVAASRAETELQLSCVERRNLFGDWVDRDPSPFLDELKPLIDSGDVAVINPSPAERDAGRSGAWNPGAARRSRQQQQWARRTSQSQPPRRPEPQRTYDPRTVATSRTAATSTAAVGATRNQAPAGPRMTADQLTAGTQVRHSTFGAGTVAAIDTKAGTVTVAFADKRRVLMYEHAPLTPGP